MAGALIRFITFQEKIVFTRSYVQEMMTDSRYNEEEIIAVIENLGKAGRKKIFKKCSRRSS